MENKNKFLNNKMFKLYFFNKKLLSLSNKLGILICYCLHNKNINNSLKVLKYEKKV